MEVPTRPHASVTPTVSSPAFTSKGRNRDGASSQYPAPASLPTSQTEPSSDMLNRTRLPWAQRQPQAPPISTSDLYPDPDPDTL